MTSARSATKGQWTAKRRVMAHLKRIGVKQRLLTDCLVLLVSLVLTEPRTTPRQQKMIGKLIGKLKKELK